MQHYSSAARMGRFTSTRSSHEHPSGIFAYLDSRRTPGSAQMALKLGPKSRLMSLPVELLQMIVDLVAEDKKDLPNFRLVCKLFEKLSENYFHRAFLVQLHVAPTRKAFRRLLWTARLPELSRSIQSITTLYDNEEFAEHGTLCSGVYARGKVDLLLETLEHLHHIGRRVDLIVTVAKPPLDPSSSVIAILHRVLGYLLFGYPVHGPPGVRNIFLDIDDTSSAALPILTDPSEQRFLAEDYGPRYHDIWARMIEIGTLEQVQVRFSRKGEKTQSLRHLTFLQRFGRIDAGMQNLGTWHFDIMGRMTIFSEVISMKIENCALESFDLPDLFNSQMLQHLVLRNVSVFSTYRLFNPPRTIQDPGFWDDTLLHIAGSTDLQSLWVEHLIDADGQILYTEPWFVRGTQERSVSETIMWHFP
ncbi:hypothetical protein QM012_002593 [Aureobasidium pullulans]|uniref:F-box domain-containing protein n=1 Tax=Aureobasidium pullulans TaxID=5580 RepID=A0ABR0TA01_AURPU